MTQTVACLGDSITKGQVSAPYVERLASQFPEPAYRWINAGVNNDTTYNLLRRAYKVIEACPDVVTIMIGTNDMIASLSWGKSLFYRINRRLPYRPSQESAVGNVRQLVRQLKTETNARIALISIPFLGEDLTHKANQRVILYNQSLKELAGEEKIAYLPFFERLCENLDPNCGRAFTNSIPLAAEFLSLRLLTGLGYDAFSLRKGFHFMLDSVHLNTRAALLVGELIGGFLTQTSHSS